MTTSTQFSGRADLFPCAACHVCKLPLPAPVLDLGLQPMCDDLVQIGDNRITDRYPIQISICSGCFTAHQAWQIRKETLFPSDYHYRPRFTQDVLSGMEQLVAETSKQFLGLEGKLVCDVGCNDGSLLGYFEKAGAQTCGIEPTNAALEARTAGHIVVNEFFGPKSAEELAAKAGKPDVITFTNVFAHIENLDEAIDALKLLIHKSSLVVIENHYLGTVLSTNQFDTFYHEHPRTYSMRSFEVIAKLLGGEVLLATFPKRYGGNIRVFIGNFAGSKHFSKVDFPSIEEEWFPTALTAMQSYVDQWKSETLVRIANLRNGGLTLSGKSFPGRAAILIALLGLTVEDQPCVYEKPGSLKLGHYIPGTRIPIVSDEKWINEHESPDGVIIWAWHIADEVALYLRKMGYKGRIFSPLPEFSELKF